MGRYRVVMLDVGVIETHHPVWVTLVTESVKPIPFYRFCYHDITCIFQKGRTTRHSHLSVMDRSAEPRANIPARQQRPGPTSPPPTSGAVVFDLSCKMRTFEGCI